ncbi:transglutaminase-like domain-containing protein [Mucilaginibacter segetis]|uniref:Transglutaminase domain-containing protein n=1 Tax=Mucilaginibacter segetis TaxID=2793071 RepID=A0A934PRN4_9SPHI|nr:transglutaminase-like domain-containing protein [Mucilaginibacter segetis]MBK0378854.1 transglutaminase domain-containing protein [Mucilaginibacter segetis]
MKNKIYFFLIYLFTVNSLFAQTATEDPFVKFGNQQSDLLHQAYLKRDAQADKKLVDEFVARYKQLNDNDQKMYKGYITNAYYNLSCLYSLNNDKAKAFEYLDSAVNYGYMNYSHLQEDSDFANIKNEPEFKKISESMRSVGDYMYILKKGEKYNADDNRVLPAFTYQPASAPELVALKKAFNLDSIAGKGDEQSKVLNILHWVHNSVAHDGQHESGIKLINADEILTTAKQKNVGVSCGELATTMVDCYQALGFKARKVYCFPKDSLNIDYDSHVINVVYLPKMNKWVWVDPTNDAYVTDENGTLLSIAEVRDRIINNKPLVLNPDANWNHKQKIVKENYLYYYMAKNLYYLYSPLKSEYNYETKGNNKTITYVSLVPLDYFKQGPFESENVNKDTGLKIVRYKTNNPELFWKLPEAK